MGEFVTWVEKIRKVRWEHHNEHNPVTVIKESSRTSSSVNNFLYFHLRSFVNYSLGYNFTHVKLLLYIYFLPNFFILTKNIYLLKIKFDLYLQLTVVFLKQALNSQVFFEYMNKFGQLLEMASPVTNQAHPNYKCWIDPPFPKASGCSKQSTR